MKKKKVRVIIMVVVLAVILACVAYFFRGRFVSTNDSVSYNPETQKALIVYYSGLSKLVGDDTNASIYIC